MKILFLAPANSIHTVRWVNALAERGNKVVLASLSNHRDEKKIIAEKVKIVYLPVQGTKGYYLNAHYLFRLYKKICPDVVNAHYASGYGTLARIARLPHLLLSVWGSDVYDFPYESKIKMYILKKNLLYAERLASTSNAMARQVERLIGKRKIAITPFGVDIDRFKKAEELKKEQGIFTVGIVKTLDYKYGIDVVIKAFSIFDKRMGKEAAERRLVIYGEGKDREELGKLCYRLGIERKVIFKGTIDNSKVPLALNQMDAACFGSRLDSESFGVSVVEAMACEVPVVVTDTDGFKEVVVDGQTGYIVKRDDCEEMAEKICLLFQDGETRRRFGSNGRIRVKELYDWERNVNEMIDIYNKITEEKKNGD